jgi:signal recognition particle receptor subunit beta
LFINWQSKELNLKIVYYGAALSGKTTNLEWMHQKIAPTMRGNLVSLKTREDRTIFFDFMQIELGEIKGLKPKFNLYTVPGQVFYVASRKLVLQGADGVVFVVDSQPDRMKDNIETWRNLQTNLRELGNDPATFPIVFQYNKRDMPNAMTIEAMRVELGCDGRPQVEAVAVQGIGVFEALRPTIKAVLDKIMTRL